MRFGKAKREPRLRRSFQRVSGTQCACVGRMIRRHEGAGREEMDGKKYDTQRKNYFQLIIHEPFH